MAQRSATYEGRATREEVAISVEVDATIKQRVVATVAFTAAAEHEVRNLEVVKVQIAIEHADVAGVSKSTRSAVDNGAIIRQSIPLVLVCNPETM